MCAIMLQTQLWVARHTGSHSLGVQEDSRPQQAFRQALDRYHAALASSRAAAPQPAHTFEQALDSFKRMLARSQPAAQKPQHSFQQALYRFHEALRNSQPVAQQAMTTPDDPVGSLGLHSGCGLTFAACSRKLRSKCLTRRPAAGPPHQHPAACHRRLFHPLCCSRCAELLLLLMRAQSCRGPSRRNTWILTRLWWQADEEPPAMEAPAVKAPAIYMSRSAK